MITEISLYNWKSFDSAVLFIDQITFLIGTNSSGKSNLVDALSFLSRLTTGEKLSETCKSIRGGIDQIIRRGCKDASIAINFKGNNNEYRYSIAFSVNKSEAYVNKESLEIYSSENLWKPLFTTDKLSSGDVSENIKVYFEKDRSGTKEISLRRDITVLSQVQGQNVLKAIKDGAKVAIDTMALIYVVDPTPARMRDFVGLSETLKNDGSNVAGVISAMPDEEAKAFEKRLTGYVSKLPEKDIRKIWTERVGRFKDTAMLYCREDWGGEDPMEIDARSMSDGTLRFIAIIVALLTRPADSLVVIEEIDNGLHPSRTGELVYALLEIAASRDFDVLCTTHNPVLIDALGNDVLQSVSCVSREGSKGSSTISRLTERPDFLRDLAQFTPGNMMTNNRLSFK
ncbi:MAG: ATP-binding protein [Muribaculaceae bacterium]|nr:ATP-binding protein [Muribaculaceae bacterium]